MKYTDIAAQRTPDLFVGRIARGGRRPGAGRKGIYGEETKPVKIPVSRVEEVKAYLRGEEASQQSLEAIRRIIHEWEHKAAAYQNLPRAKQGHFRAACDILRELQAAIERD